MEGLVGRVVISKAGRDRGRSFVVMKEKDASCVWIVDGDLRKLDKPKAKKLKHLQLTNTFFDEFASLDLAQEKNNSIIRNFIRSIS